MSELVFESDEDKARHNLRKHRVDFEEAKTVFADPRAALFHDEDHSAAEERELVIGYSDRNRLLIVSFTERHCDVIRIISARLATKREQTHHEKSQGR